MSGYGPFGFSQTLAYVTYAFKSKTSSKTGDNGQIAARAVYVLLRFLLAVDTSLIFELMGAFILTQVGYDGFDFKTHKKAEAIVFIGGVGGAAAGLTLIIVDALFRSLPKINDTNVKGDDAAAKPDIDTILSGCIVRIFLWPGLGALGGLTGTILWHLRQDTGTPSLHQWRGATGAVVQTIGAVISVPSFVQFIGIGALTLAQKLSK